MNFKTSIRIYSNLAITALMALAFSGCDVASALKQLGGPKDSSSTSSNTVTSAGIATATDSGTNSITATETATATLSATATATMSATATVTHSATATATMSASATATSTASATGTVPPPPPPPVTLPSSGNYVAGNGANVSGAGALSVPTAKAIIGRLEAVMGVAQSSQFYFNKASGTLTPTIAYSTDPTMFAGADSNMALAYAACVDNRSGAKFGINMKLNIATPADQVTLQPQLVAAGLQILDLYTGGLANQGAAKPQLTAAFNAIVAQSIANVPNGTTTQMAWISVCTAANTAGTTLLGF